ncbi:MAG: tetratricopeptide repeat protein [Bacteroidetes bacterium]|nr:tetratricopeptide repeat protein [Bacteroidota bacterium]
MIKTLLVWLPAVCCPLLLSAQPLSDVMWEMYEMDNFEGAIELALEADSLCTSDIYTLGLCYYSVNEDLLAVEQFSKVLEEKPKHAGAHFFNGQSLMFLGLNQQAIQHLKQAVSLEPDHCDYLTGLGSAYHTTGRPDSALLCYKKALALGGCMENLYIYRAKAFEALEKQDSALAVYYQAVNKLSPESEIFEESMYHIGMYEYLNGNLEMAEKAFHRLIEIRPHQLHYVPKLIQVYYALEEYEKGDSLKQKLYGANERGELDEAFVKDGFCFDQFTWRGKRIYAYESIGIQGPLYNKYVFFVAHPDGEVIRQIQLEHRPDVLDKGYYFVLTHTNYRGHENLWQYLFEKDVEYQDIKKSVLRILRQEKSK